MSNIVLTPGIRQNLLSLQNTAALMESTQNRLATGKKVNSALDNPVSFFTSQTLSNRANDLSNLLDSIGQGQQTLQAANQGITSLTTLINSLKSLATQAQQAAPATATYANNIVGNTAIANDTSHAVSSNTSAALTGLQAAAHSTYTIDTAALATTAATDGDTITLSDGTHTLTLEKVTAGAPAAGHVGFTNKADIKTALAAFFGSQYSVSTDTATITGSDYTTNFSAVSYGGADAAALGTAAAVAKTNAIAGDALTLNVGSTSATLHYVASGASAGAGTFTTAADLVAAVNASAVGNPSGTLNSNIHAAVDSNNNITFDSLNTSSFAASGTLATGLGISSSSINNSTLSGLTGVLSITVGSGTAQTIDFSAIHTKAALTTALAGLTGVTGGIDGSGHITLSSTTSDNITIGGTNNAASGLFTGANVGLNAPTVTAGTSSATRATLQSNYNGLLTQIDQLTGDSSYNGINLINGDNLKIVFNENGSSALNITGVTLNSAGLGLTALSSNEFQSNGQIDTVISHLNDSLAQLRAQASAFGSTLTTVQTRQDFTKNLINTLQVGSDNLVLADTNEEGANLLALQTRQSLSTTALSMANQANQAVLRLFG
jgi:flagellin